MSVLSNVQCISTISINSTVGLSSLYHGTPTICLGRANYDIDGLTAKGINLDKFWNLDMLVDINLFIKYRTYLIRHTQINTNFYR